MGEISIIAGGFETTIDRDGYMKTVAVKRCDECDSYQPTLGGTSTFNAGDEILWICASCRTPR